MNIKVDKKFDSKFNREETLESEVKETSLKTVFTRS